MSASEPIAVNRQVVAALDARFRRPLMSFFLRRLGDHAEAEDLTQQVFTRLLGVRVDELEHTERFVFTIAANLLRDRGRRLAHRRERPLAQVEGDLVANISQAPYEEISPERVLLGRETLADVFRTLDELGEKTRNIFVLHRLENMKHREIAEIMGVSVSTVEKHIIKAIMHLAVKYGRRR